MADLKSDDVLAHFGVKGMKWGVRKDRTSSGSKKTSRYSTGPEKLSNKELKARVDRMRTEQEYRKLNQRPSGSLARGAKAVGNVLSKSGQNAASTALTTVATAATIYGAKVAIDKSFGPGTTAKLWPKKK